MYNLTDEQLYRLPEYKLKKYMYNDWIKNIKDEYFHHSTMIRTLIYMKDSPYKWYSNEESSCLINYLCTL